MREIEFKITDKDHGRQIRDFLRNFGVSSALLTKLKQSENGITLNGEFARTIEKVYTGDTLKIVIESKGKMPKKLENNNVSVAYNDEILTFDAYVTNGSDTLLQEKSPNKRLWGDLSMDFIAMQPKRYAL